MLNQPYCLLKYDGSMGGQIIGVVAGITKSLKIIILRPTALNWCSDLVITPK